MNVHCCAQIKQLFGFCGGVIGIDRVGEQKQFLFVEYTYPSVQPTPLCHP